VAGGQERVLRRRIRSVQSTMKITRAQELIAASRIVRAQRAIEAARPYVAKMAEVVTHLVDTPEGAAYPLLRQDEAAGRRAAVIMITADRGFAGAYNTSVIRATERVVREHRGAGREVSIIAVGRKGENYFRFRQEPLAASITGVSDRPSYEDARRVVATISGPLAEGEIGWVQLVFTRFVSAGSQQVVVRQLIPLEDQSGSGGTGVSATAPGGRASGELPTVYEFEPDPGEILDRLIPSWLEAEVLAAMLNASASEQAARQRAMKAATDNADELIKNLRRVMNRARQDSITTEIMEIVGGAEALRSGGGKENFTETYEASAESA
jgi:F-type H+-transporting ATPase subunit gamma